MEFTPSSIMVLLSGVPLDNTYKDTMTFASASAQSTYMLTKQIKRFDAQTYSRHTSGVLKLQVVADEVFNANYLMFQNTNFGSKWFYAFVLDVEYISQSACLVKYEIDVMQTWLFDYQIKQSFVEREHVNDDTIGSNTIPEGLELGGYITTNQNNHTIGELTICVLATEDLDGANMQPPGLIGGFPITCYWRGFSLVSDFDLNAGSFQSLLDLYASAGKADSIVSVFTIPNNFFSVGASIHSEIVSCASRILSITPKNNKLFTYPYCSLAINALGQGNELRYELFSGSPQLKIRGGFGVNMQVSANPINYEGQSESYQNMITIKDFPVLPWVSNYFQNWIAQNKAQVAISTVSNVISLGVGIGATIATGGLAIGSLASGISGIANTMGEVYKHSILPDKMTGQATAGDILAVSNLTGFYTYCRTIRAEYAQVIDDYFSMFGYKVNKVKVPNVTGRSKWNYVKTIDAVVVGSCPTPAIAKIREILNKGVTFWHTENVGDYSVTNSIV